MKIKIDVQDLKLGMYVCELDRPWRETPFLFQGFRIQSHADIEELQRYCQFVLINAEHAEAATRDKRIELEILRASAPARQPREPRYVDRATLDEELESAASAYRSAGILVENLLHDARLGKGLDAEGVKHAVRTVLASILRNPDAMMCLSQLKQRHAYTAEHGLRVCVLALTVGRHLNLPDDSLNTLGIGALLHDIGKARVPTELLDRPAPLTRRELDIVRQHVPLGVKTVEDLPGIPSASVAIVAQHHERHDGSGYMQGLRGQEIDRLSAITALADVYDALTSDRAYRNAIAAHTALKQMYLARGGAFPGELTEKFIQCLGVYPIGSLVEFNTGQVGVVVTRNRQRALRPRVLLVLDRDKNAFAFPHYIDLAAQPRDLSGLPWEIRSVLDSGTFGIHPADYMPTHSHRRFGNLG